MLAAIPFWLHAGEACCRLIAQKETQLGEALAANRQHTEALQVGRDTARVPSRSACITASVWLTGLHAQAENLALKNGLQTAHGQAADAERCIQQHSADKAEIRAELAAAARAAGCFHAELQSQSSAGELAYPYPSTTSKGNDSASPDRCALRPLAAVLRLEKAVTSSMQSQAALAGTASPYVLLCFIAHSSHATLHHKPHNPLGCWWLLHSHSWCSAARVQEEQQKSRLVQVKCDQRQRQLQDQQGLLARFEDQKAAWYEHLAIVLHVDGVHVPSSQLAL